MIFLRLQNPLRANSELPVTACHSHLIPQAIKIFSLASIQTTNFTDVDYRVTVKTSIIIEQEELNHANSP